MLAKKFPSNIISVNCKFCDVVDNKPVLVITHGDELSISQRAHVRTYLGELLGIPPLQQIFDISGGASNLFILFLDKHVYSIWYK